ncbi:MAG: alpha/beta hydrolase [Myxococcota bacterium]
MLGAEARVRLVLLLCLAALLACDAAPPPPGPVPLEQALAARWDPLELEVVTRLPEERTGGRAIVLLHGYGSRGSDMRPLAEALLGDDIRVFLPTAALPHENGWGAIWWEFIEGDWPKPYSDDPSANAWPEPSKQLPRAREAVERLLGRIRARYRPEVLALAGHSQGAMLALDVAAGVSPPVDRVAAVAGYVLLDSMPRIEKPRAFRPPVFIAHGRSDPIVGFDAAGRMRRVLEAHGFPVTLYAHPGDHGIDPGTVRALRAFLLEDGD